MTRFGLAVFGGILVVIALIAGILFLHHARTLQAVPAAVMESTSTPAENPSALSIYTNGEYGFSFFYPADGVVTDTFSTSTQNAWRTHALAKGVLVVRIATDQGQLSFGESSSTREKSACLSAGPSEIMTTPVTVGSTTWKQFTFDKIGTDNEQHVTSYRTLRDATCFAFELSEPTSVTTTASTTYAIKDSITSFTFAH
ncbi:MAG: hypothetical protein JWL75_308 [Parcubacteria group bacterium]|nr:hypothetical protein [Parcubacteria group bacterium]